MPVVGPHEVERVVAALLGGNAVALPTDTVYGLAALPQADAVERLYELKGRDPSQPIALLVDSRERAAGFVEPVAVYEALAARWPGPLTLVVRPRAGVELAARLVGPDGGIGLRVPDDALALAVIRGCGGMLAVTSANRSGEPPLATAEAIAACFGAELLVLDGGPREGVASTVVDLTVEPPLLLRIGALDAEALGLAR
jgi:L-threonylcarbamoyladenylate synthase